MTRDQILESLRAVGNQALLDPPDAKTAQAWALAVGIACSAIAGCPTDLLELIAVEVELDLVRFVANRRAKKLVRRKKLSDYVGGGE